MTIAIIATIINVIVAKSIIANEFEILNREYAIDYWIYCKILEKERRRKDAIKKED